MSTIAEALTATRGKLPATEARLLLCHVLQRPPVWVLSHDDEELQEEQLALFASFCARRRGGEPIAYLIGIREFYGRDFHTAPGALIPRPETELLVELVTQKVGAGGTAQVLDLGTGSGCIAISIALERPQVAVTAIDASATALAIAQRNAEQLKAKLRFIESDWFSALTNEKFDLIVSNPPYIAAADPHLAQGDLRHEPLTALASGADGLDAIRHIIANAPHFLKPRGGLWLEHGYDQAEPVKKLLLAAGFTQIEQIKDMAGIVRISGGIRQ